MGKSQAGQRLTSRFRPALAVAVAIVGAGAGSAARAQDARPLAWKFKAGETLHYRMDQNTKTQAKFADQNLTTTVNQVMEMSWAVRSVDESGAATIAQTIDAIRTKIESPIGNLEFDSKSGKDPVGPLAAGIAPSKALVGKTFEYTMSPNGELKDVKVPGGLIKALREADPTGQASGMLSEQGLKSMISEMGLVLKATPDMPSWTRETKVPQPPIGTLRFVRTYTREPGTQGGLDRIAMKTNVTLEPGPDAEPGFVAKLVDQNGNGEFLFDNEKGRVTSSKVKVHMQLDLTKQNMSATQITDTTTEIKLVPGGQAGAEKAKTGGN
jgi:hypothetical protein